MSDRQAIMERLVPMGIIKSMCKAAELLAKQVCKPIDWTKVQLDLDAIVREVDADERRRKVIRRFQRTMKRHERRARRLGLPKAALTLAVVRSAANAKDERWMREHAAHCRSVAHAYGKARRVAWLYERAAEAVARLRSDLEAVK